MWQQFGTGLILALLDTKAKQPTGPMRYLSSTADSSKPSYSASPTAVWGQHRVNFAYNG